MARNLSLEFDNYMLQADLVCFLERETLSSEFGPIGYISFLFPLWVQSEGRPLRSGPINSRLIERSPEPRPALIAIGDVNGGTTPRYGTCATEESEIRRHLDAPHVSAMGASLSLETFALFILSGL